MPKLRIQYLVYINADLVYVSFSKEEAYNRFKEICETERTNKNGKLIFRSRSGYEEVYEYDDGTRRVIKLTII